MDQDLKISVVIPTRNNEELIKTCLTALENQTKKPNQIFVVSESDNVEKLNLDSSEIYLEYIHSDKPIGPSALRNIGIRKSTGDIIVFLDDDSIPQNDFIEQTIIYFEDRNIGIIRGKIVDTHSLSKNLAEHYDLGESLIEISPRLLVSCCMAMRKSILDEIAGYDESIPYGHEEVDLGYRAYSIGYRSFYAPKAIVNHNYIRSISHYLKKQYRWGKRRHQLKKHDVKMIGTKRIILNSVPILSLLCLAGFIINRSNFLLIIWLLMLFAPLIFWTIQGMFKFRNPFFAVVYSLGKISGDIGYIIGML